MMVDRLCVLLAVDELFRSAGVASDGFIHYEEFVRTMALPSGTR